MEASQEELRGQFVVVDGEYIFVPEEHWKAVEQRAKAIVAAAKSRGRDSLKRDGDYGNAVRASLRVIFESLGEGQRRFRVERKAIAVGDRANLR